MECLAATHCGDVAEICGAIKVQTRTGHLIHNMVRRLPSLPTCLYPFPTDMSAPPLDILALAAHRDDVEQTCGGTMLKMAQLGHRTGILDLTQGEMGTRGSAEDRAREAEDAARILCTSWRYALDIPDGRVENTWENRLKVVRVLREQRPRVVILPYWKGRHPDHYTASVLGYEACFLAGLAKLDVSHQVAAVSPQAAAFSPQPSAVSEVGAIAGTSPNAGATVGGHAFSRAESKAQTEAALAAEG